MQRAATGLWGALSPYTFPHSLACIIQLPLPALPQRPQASAASPSPAWLSSPVGSALEPGAGRQEVERALGGADVAGSGSVGISSREDTSSVDCEVQCGQGGAPGSREGTEGHSRGWILADGKARPRGQTGQGWGQG